MDNCIRIKGARAHNLKNINVEIPRDQLVVITGLSGSGKSSLAFDALIPVILLFCLLYSPVLMDLRDFIPGYKVLSWLAPTKWYFALHNFIL